ncbi:SET and MYND domain-containing protein 5 [Aplysia californica]|uniref:Protein-lysine N-trimethyltransferase SMYD5 n=1 Tax=Aplysia californica TaxID=6500 RepID=A0ABM0JYZ5_APLCA|nr:SET and MYND domain-containing protein 5 [Aplysia californica]
MAAPMESVSVKQISETKGKGLIARKSFKKGDVILEEKPVVCAQFSWNELYNYKACEFCLRSLEKAEKMAQRLTGNTGVSLPHPECCQVDPSSFVQCPQCQVVYCSPACRDAAFSLYHQVLCMGSSREDPAHPLAVLGETWRSFHYPPETASIMLLAKMIAMIKQASDKGSVLSMFSGFISHTVNQQEHIAHKLLGEKFKVQREVLREQLAAILYEEAAQEWFTPEGFNSLVALIGTNGQGIGSSSFSSWVKATEQLSLSEQDKAELDNTVDKLYNDMWEVSGQFLDCEGSGLYQLQSASNHSCAPNAEVSFPHGDHTLVMVALEDIEPEQEINISYLSWCDLDIGRHSRHKALRENYLFQCSCQMCISQADDESCTSDDDEEEDMDDEYVDEN